MTDPNLISIAVRKDRERIADNFDSFFNRIRLNPDTAPDHAAVRLCRLMADNTLTAMDAVIGKQVVPDAPDILTFIEAIDSFIDGQREQLDDSQLSLDLGDYTAEISPVQHQEIEQFVTAQERRALQIDALELFATMVLFQMCALQKRPE
jgi:hypothetical protein